MTWKRIVLILAVGLVLLLLVSIYGYYRACGDLNFPDQIVTRRGSGGICVDGWIGYYLN